MKVGQVFSIRTQNTRTITSGNAEGVETWKIDHIEGDDISCELRSTNMSMYSGGYFRLFTEKEISKHLNK